MTDLEVRELQYFLAVAEELHFRRAAERLRIAQPALSKSIQRLEARLGVRLFDRTNRRVLLTRAGEALFASGPHALSSMTAAAESAQRAGRGDDHLRLVFKPGGDGGLLSRILGAYAAAPGALDVDLLFSSGTERSDYLRDGRADVGLLYVPFDDLNGLLYETLLVEGRVAVLPLGHRLADRPRLRLSDLDGEVQPRWKGLPSSTSRGPEVSDVSELGYLVSTGRAAAILPASLVQPVPEGTVSVPVEDAPTSRIVIAWAAHDTRPLVHSFVVAASDPKAP